MFFVSPSVYAQESDLQAYFAQGQQAYQNGDYSAAIEFFEKAVEVNPNFAPLYNSLGLVHMAINAGAQDIIWFFKVATEIDPQYAEAYGNLCKTYYQAGEMDPAEQACVKALEINPDFSSAQLSMAWIYLLGKSDPAKAVPYFKEILSKIDNPTIYFGLGMAYAKSGNNAQVLDVITTLRSMGQEQYAARLESVIRTPVARTAPISDPFLPSPPKRASTIISAGPASVPTDAVRPGGGVAKIRLRGKLSSVLGGLGSTGQPQTGSAATPDEASVLERIKKVRQQRGSGVRVPVSQRMVINPGGQ